MELKVYNQKAEEVGKVKLSSAVFGVSWNADLVHQVVVSMRSNARKIIAYAKTRADVRGGGKKPWRQKGTGRARHGSSRSPIWIGGGVTHGPTKEKNYFKKINKKMKRKALFCVLSKKAEEGEILVLDDLKLPAPRTKEAAMVISNLSAIGGFEKMKNKKGNRALVLIKGKDENLKRAFRNLPGVVVDEARNLNVLDTLTYKYLIFSKDALKSAEKVGAEK